MYDLAELKTHLTAELPNTYKIDWAKAKEMDLGTALDSPVVRIGYHSVEADGSLDDGDTPDPYQAYSEDLVQFVILQFACNVSELPAVWKLIYAACATWTPIPSEADYSNFMHSGGGVMGLKDGRIWWLDKWRLSFPRVSTEWV